MPDYFQFMGFPRQLALDEEQLQQRYYSLSREYHPDFHTLADEPARMESLERSSLLNQAYRTLKDPYERARYLLDLEWPDIPEADRKKIPPALLMEVMEMQEKISEAQFESDESKRAELDRELRDLEARLKVKMNGLRVELDAISSDWNALTAEASAEEKRELLSRLNTLLNTRNYMRTLLATIDSVVRGGPGVRH
jgi:molecular chaperone HscB